MRSAARLALRHTMLLAQVGSESVVGSTKGWWPCLPASHQALRDMSGVAAPTASYPGFKIRVFGSEEWVKSSMSQPMLSTFPETSFFESKLDATTAELAHGADAVVLFVNDDANGEVVRALHGLGVRYIAMRCAGYDRVDLDAARECGIRVVNVPTYSPESIAEHAVTLLLSLNRSIPNINVRVRIGNYSLVGLTAELIGGLTVGVVGTGAIGAHFSRIMRLGFGCRVLAQDLRPRQDLQDMGVEYVELDTLYRESDVLSLHCPLLPSTEGMINSTSMAKMKEGVTIINTSRGGLIHTPDLCQALLSGKVGAVGLDVYEQERGLFFRDFTREATRDRMSQMDTNLLVLRTLPNVIITPHSAFLTSISLREIATTTIANLRECAEGRASLTNEVPHSRHG